MLFVQGTDDLLRVEHIETLDGLDVAGGDLAFFVDGERKLLRFVVLTIDLELHLFEVEHDVGHVLNDTGQSGELVLRARDLHRSNRGAFERGKQDAAKRISNGVTVTGFKRLGAKLGVSLCGCILVFSENFWHLKTTVTNWHDGI